MDLQSWYGVIGVFLLLAAYFLTMVKVLKMNTVLYYVLNILGAGFAGYSSYLIEFWPFVVLEAVWVVVSFVPLIRLLIRGNTPAASE